MLFESIRFNKKRIDEGLETMTMKATMLRQQTDGSVLLEKLHQEIREYKGILKCRVCHDHQKEVSFIIRDYYSLKNIIIATVYMSSCQPCFLGA